MTTTIAHVLPTPVAVRTLLSQLTGRDVATRTLAALPAHKGTSVVAVYVCDDDTPCAVWVSTVSVAAASGAALSGIPAGAVSEQVTRDRLTDMTLENFRELMNVGASLFNVGHAPHVRLSTLVQMPSDGLPPAAADLLKNATKKLVMHHAVAGYGEGPSWILLP